MDGQTDWQGKTSIPPFKFVEAGGIMIPSMELQTNELTDGKADSIIPVSPFKYYWVGENYFFLIKYKLEML